MPKYRKRPIVVDAEQWFPGKAVRGVHGSFAGQSRERATYPEGAYDIHGPSVVTIHRQVAGIDPGDWVIAESDGVHFYPCKPDEFDRIYEPAD